MNTIDTVSKTSQELTRAQVEAVVGGMMRHVGVEFERRGYLVPFEYHVVFSIEPAFD